MARRQLAGLLSTALLLTGCARAVTPVAAVHVNQLVPLPVITNAPPPAVSPLDADGLLTKQAFAQEVARSMERASPGWTAVVENSELVGLWQEDRYGASLPVGPLYESYRSNPSQKSELVTLAVDRALKVQASAPAWESASRQILPQFMASDQCQTLDQSGGLVVSVPLSEEICMVYQLKVAGVSLLVHQGLQAAWGVPLLSLHNAAVENLSAVTPPMERGHDGVWRFPVADGYQAERLFLVKRLAEVDARGEGTLVVAIPARGSLYAFDDSDPQLVAAMRARTDAEYERSAAPLTTTWLQVDGERLVVYQSPQR